MHTDVCRQEVLPQVVSPKYGWYWGTQTDIWLAGLEEALIASLADAEGANGATGAPPASKHAVKSLVREHLTEQRLQQLGGSGTQCAVYRSTCSCCFRHHNDSYSVVLKFLSPACATVFGLKISATVIFGMDED